MKKKVVALMMSAVMAFSLAACGDNAATNGSGSADPNGGAALSSPVRVRRKVHRKVRLSRKARGMSR